MRLTSEATKEAQTCTTTGTAHPVLPGFAQLASPPGYELLKPSADSLTMAAGPSPPSAPAGGRFFRSVNWPPLPCRTTGHPTSLPLESTVGNEQLFTLLQHI